MMNFLKSRTGIIFLILVLVVSFFVMSKKVFSPTESELLLITFSTDVVVQASVADTPAMRTLGLSGHQSLDSDEAMLFVFETPGIYPFWMKDMSFLIDIFWLDEDKRIVFIKESAHPEDYPASYVSPEPARYVIETIAGFAQEHGIEIGESVSW